MKNSREFGLIEIIVIIIITAIVSIIATGVIMLKGNANNINIISKDKELQEFVEVYNTIVAKYYDDIDKEGLLNAAEEGMINFLGDKYTTYLNDKEYSDILDELGATYSGIGISIEGNRIIKVTKDSPAEKSGILEGDLITRIDGVEVDSYSNSQIKNYIKACRDFVELEITRNEEILNFRIKKEKLENVVIDYKVLEGTKTGYIYISKFSSTLDSQMDSALSELETKGIDNLIIDVRDNVGGYLTSAEKTASLFLEEGKKIYSLKNSNSEKDYKDQTKDKRTYPIVVLINNNTASSAEILAAALKDSYNAVLVGTKSYGKGKVQEVSKLDNGDSVKLTTAKWLTPNGICIDGIGITPDYNVDGDINQLNKAVEILNGSVSINE